MSHGNSALLFFFSVLVGACGGGGGGGGGSGPAQISGTLQFTPVSTLVSEQEPNDALDAATPAGELRAIAGGEPGATSPATPDESPTGAPGGTARLALAGELGGADRIDAFALLARHGTRVEATLRPSTPLAGEVELSIFDAVEQRFVAGSRAEDGAQVCRFEARGSFDLVVRGAGTAGAYRIDVVSERAELVSRTVASRPGYEPRPDERLSSYLVPVLESRAGEFVVLAREGADLSGTLARRGLERAARIPGAEELVRFALPAAADQVAARRATVARMRALAEEPDVAHCELNLLRRPLGGAPVTPQDGYYPLQWHYPLIHLPEAWSVTTGDDAVIVAVLDTGETPHPDLVARQIPGFDMIEDADSAGDFDGYDDDPTDEGDGDGLQPSSWHGTHVAGTIGASTNDANASVAGVTWAGKIMHVRVLGRSGGTNFDIASGVRYAARLANASGALPAQRAHVINLSLGGPGSSSTVQSAVTAARSAGSVIFAAAGNNNSGVAFFPAAASGVISISAVDINANKAPYSNFHSTVDFCAPGGDVTQDLNADGYPDGVLSTLVDDSTTPASFIYAFYQGTSMACPHAAGVAALMLAADPEHDLTPAQIESFLQQSAHDLGAPGRDDVYGHGLIDAFLAVQLAGGTGPQGPVLAVSPAQLAFGATQTNLTLDITNLGSGTIDVTSVVADSAPTAWLSVVPGPASSGASVGSVTVTVDRAGLALGDYAGSVTIETSNAGAKIVPVTMQVSPVVPPVDVTLYVLAVDIDSFDTLAQAIANPTQTLDYVLGDLPAGTYLVACGSDDDDDGFICGEGDLYCGFYPTVNEPLAIEVDAGESVEGADFPVTPLATTNGAGASGFRRLH